MDKPIIDEDFVDLIVSIVNDDIESKIMEIIVRNEDQEIILQKVIEVLEKEQNDQV